MPAFLQVSLRVRDSLSVSKHPQLTWQPGLLFSCIYSSSQQMVPSHPEERCGNWEVQDLFLMQQLVGKSKTLLCFVLSYL